MPTSLTRFEVQLPIYDNFTQTAQYNAVNTFITNLLAMTSYVEYEGYVNGVTPQIRIIYGLITVAQQPAALNLLTTLNNTLVAAGSPTVLCTTNTVNTQP